MTGESNKAVLKIKAQVLVGDAIAIGPGKADLLEAVAETGSIAAAGRKLGLSYRRTRDMIDTLNASWKVPLVDTVKGGTRGGGTTLTTAGAEVLHRYRALQEALARAAEAHGADLLALAGLPADRETRSPTKPGI
jgi:molybdate transport system regulatory protein